MIYNLHLESRADDRLRMMQLSETVEDAKKYLDRDPVVVAGDLNADLSRSYSSAAVLERLGFHSAIALPGAYTTPARGISSPAHYRLGISCGTCPITRERRL